MFGEPGICELGDTVFFKFKKREREKEREREKYIEGERKLL